MAVAAAHSPACAVFKLGTLALCDCGYAKGHDLGCSVWEHVYCDCALSGTAQPQGQLGYLSKRDPEDTIPIDLDDLFSGHTCQMAASPLWKAGKAWAYCKKCGNWLKEWAP